MSDTSTTSQATRLISTWAKARARLHNVWLFDLASRQRMRREAEKRYWDLPADYDVGTYPQPSTVVHVEPARRGAALGAIALLAGVLGAVGSALLPSPDSPTAEPQQAGPQRAIVDVWTDEGGVHSGIRPPENAIPLWERAAP